MSTDPRPNDASESESPLAASEPLSTGSSREVSEASSVPNTNAPGPAERSSTDTEPADPASNLEASSARLAPVSTDAELDDPTALITRWFRDEWRRLMEEIVERRAAPPAIGRLDLRHIPWAGANLSSVEIRWADLRGAELRGARLGGADLCGCDLRGADLQGANLKGADLCAVNFSDANLAGADLSFVDLSHGKLISANLRGTLMPGADLSGVDLSSAILDGAQLSGTLYDDDTRWPVGFDPGDHGLVHED